MNYFSGSNKSFIKSVLVLFCCAPDLVFAQDDFDPFATEFPPEVEDRRSAPVKRQQERKSDTKRRVKKQRTQSSSSTRSKTKTRRNSQTKRILRRKTLPAKLEQQEPSYIADSLDFKVDVGLEHNFILSAFEPSVDFAELTSDQIPSEFFSAEEILYPSLRLKGGRGLVIQARPALSALHTRFTKKNQNQGTQTTLNADSSELFVSITPSGRFSLQVGQQNFQWSPAELGSPSNWIFKSDVLGEYVTRSPQSRVETRDLIKAGLSFGQSFSLIAMAEYEEQKKERPQVYQGRRVAAKAELSWNDAASSFGVVVGGAERLKVPFVGEYFTLSLGEAFSFYGDASHITGSPVVKPVEIRIPNSPEEQRIIVFDQPNIDSDTTEHEAIVGLKYTFLSGLEFRLEGAYSSVGLTKEELALVKELERESSPLLPLFFNPGVELRSETSVFVGLRRAGFGKGGRWTLFGRYFVPLTDSSGGIFGYGEYLFSDNSVLFFSAGGYHGRAISQSAFPRRWSFSMGQKYVW